MSPIFENKTSQRVVILDSIKKREKNENFGKISNKSIEVVIIIERKIQ
jgi:hypothetical protein